MKHIKNQVIILLLSMAFSLPSAINAQTLVVGTFLGEVVNIIGTTQTYDTIYIMKNGVLNIDNSTVTINNLLTVDSVGQLNVSNSHFTMKGKNVFYANSTSILKDSLFLKGDLIVGGNANLLIDSAIVDASMTYMDQYKFLGFDSGKIQISNSSFLVGNGKFGGGFTNSSSFSQTNTIYTNSISISVTLGLLEGSSYSSNNCSGGVELIITDSATVDLDSTNWSLLWFSFANGSNANFDFPIKNSASDYASDVSYFSFSDSLPGVSGLDYNVRVQNSETVFWGIFPYAGSDVSINNSSVIACGFTFTGSLSDTLSNFTNDSLYSSYSPPISDRNLLLTNTEVSAWNFYPEDSTTLNIHDCLFGEILNFHNSKSFIENSTCDGSGGYVGAYSNSQIHFRNSTIERLWLGPPIILINDSSLLVVEESFVSGDVMINSAARLIFSNTLYDSIPQVNSSSYFLEVYVDSIPLAFTDSLVDINGTLIGVNGPTNVDAISRFRLEYSFPDSTNFLPILDTNYTPSITDNLITTWNTNGVVQGNYILWLTTYVNGDSAVTTTREIVLDNVNTVSELAAVTGKGLSIYPNPVRTSSTIRYEISKREKIEFSVYNIAGKKLSTILCTEKESGIHNILWRTKDLTPGVYLIEFKVEDVRVNIKKIVVTQ